MLKYPVGIQTFEKIIDGGFVYVDKTDLVYRLAHDGQFYFLSRPRRFGKSLLISTLKAYFEGRKELFKGLKIDQLETQWEQYPVLDMSLNLGMYNSPQGLEELLNNILCQWEEVYGSRESETTPALRFAGIVQRCL